VEFLWSEVTPLYSWNKGDACLPSTRGSEKYLDGFIHFSCSVLTAIYFPKLLTALTEFEVYFSLKIKIPEQHWIHIKSQLEWNKRISAEFPVKILAPWLKAVLSNVQTFTLCRLQYICSSTYKGTFLTHVMNIYVITKDLIRHNTCNLAEWYRHFRETWYNPSQSRSRKLQVSLSRRHPFKKYLVLHTTIS
jgi:hypothetical protein